MAGFTQAYQKTLLDYAFPTTAATDHIAYSVNGTSEWSGLGRTPVGATGWAAATTADPSVKANSGTLTSTAATAAGTVTHYAIFSASTGGTQRTDWTALDSSKAVGVGDSVSWAAGSLQVTLT